MQLIQTDDLTQYLQTRGARFTATELSLPEDLPFEDWAAIGRQLCRADKVMKWWLADWAAFGWRKHEETQKKKQREEEHRYLSLKEFAAANEIDYGGLRNLGWIGRSVDVSRRRDNVQWALFQEVAPLKPKEQEKWLAKAAEEKLPISEFRRQLRQSQGTHNALAPDGPVTKFVSKALDDLVQWLKTQPADFWTADRRALWKTRLKWLAEFYAAL